MNPPPHYRAYRLTLVAVTLVALGLATWWLAQPQVLRQLVIALFGGLR